MGQLFKEAPKQKEIILVPILFSNQKELKNRPAVIISKNEYNQKNEDIIVIPLTTNLKEKKYCIKINQDNLEKGILYYESKIRVDKINPIKQNLIIMKIGSINDETLQNIIKTLIELLTN